MIGFGEKILWQRAQEYLKKYNPTLIGVTGSSGKTLALKAIQTVLSRNHNVRAIDLETSGLKNVASAILGSHTAKKAWWRLLISSKQGEIAQAEPDTIILELNAQQPGDIDRVTRQLPFAYAVVLNAEAIQTDVFTSQGMVAHELMSLPASLPKQAVAVVNSDDPIIADMSTRLRCRVITFGTNPKADIQLVRADRISLAGFVGQISVKGRQYEFNVQHVVSRHQLYAILAAVGMTAATNGNIQEALNALRTIKLPAGRMNIVAGKNDSTIIDDSHGATPESMHHALKTLASLPADLPSSKEVSPRRIAILGDITHLGAQDAVTHTRVGELAATYCHVFVAVGSSMRHAQAAALKKGGVDTHHFNDSHDVGKWLSDYLKPGDIVLIKGSREMHMEKVVEALQKS
jgi:UDP-N-acetylmuramoyl-tripeptide--D-alanyl-D-alanine ligase